MKACKHRLFRTFYHLSFVILVVLLKGEGSFKEETFKRFRVIMSSGRSRLHCCVHEKTKEDTKLMQTTFAQWITK